MEWGERLRARARELGLADIEVARMLGLAQGRYSSYVNGSREPDLALFVRICAALQTTPDIILGVREDKQRIPARTEQLLAVVQGLDDDGAELLTDIARVMAWRVTAKAAGKPTSNAREPR